MAGRRPPGDPVRFRGELELATADGVPMGSVIRAERDVAQVLRHDSFSRLEHGGATGVPADRTLRWIEQGK